MRPKITRLKPIIPGLTRRVNQYMFYKSNAFFHFWIANNSKTMIDRIKRFSLLRIPRTGLSLGVLDLSPPLLVEEL